MRKSLNLFKQKEFKHERKLTPNRPIRKIGKNQKQSSRDRYYREKGIEKFNKEMEDAYTNVGDKKLNIG